MTGAHGLGLLLVLLLPVVSASIPSTVVRLNKATLSYVSEIGKAPLQRALQVTVPYFLDQSGEVLQPTRIQILNVHVLHFHLKFIAGFGIHLSAAANLTFKIFCVPEPLELTLPVELMADVRVAQGSIGTPVVSISTCFSLLGHSSNFDGSNSTSHALLALVQKHIKAVLSNKLCLSIASLVQGINVHLGTLIGLNPVGPESQIRYSMINEPTITSDYISLDINAVLFLLGKPIVLPRDATHFVLPQHVGTNGTMATVGLSQHLFDSALLLLQKAGALNLDITGELRSDDNPLNTSALGRLIPEVVNLSLQFSMSKVKLQGTTSVLGDIQLTVASSNVGLVDKDQVHMLMGTVFEKPLLDHLNALLGIGIALPNVINLLYVTPEVFVYEGYVVISGGLFYQH
ncbi:BPI fold-containing family B member 2 isoform X2 [Nycticebus coucang]|uniref:BPI fold-containing family B member 2 isoform X2 n=1 Tax=Nycticebus coucang TaxID=9470 RepID=UPI00234E15A1|nr:BPI fold-containing family B member 2 isoform X2 [Nycticebus coucang]